MKGPLGAVEQKN